MDLTWRQDLSAFIERVAVLGPRGLQFQTSLLTDKRRQVELASLSIAGQISTTPGLYRPTQSALLLGILVESPDEYSLFAVLVCLVGFKNEIHQRLVTPRRLHGPEVHCINAQGVYDSVCTLLGAGNG